MDLFDQQRSRSHEPLAARMRPRNLDEFIGQDHIVGKGRLLRRAIMADQLTSVIFYGPPGTGKTTLARVIANHTKSNFLTLNAVLAGVQNIRDSIKAADEQYRLYGRRTILFVDEVHRWNKSQQDALLPWVENGTIILVGATTENPFFEVNKALVSRSRVFQLKPLTNDDLLKAADAALKDRERGYGRWQVQFEEGALEHLVETANGDARSLLNALELAVETTPDEWKPEAVPCVPPENSVIYISKETAEESIQRKVVLYDRDGDYHYDIISAFIKSLRGRDPDAALYWMARMMSAGEDPHFIFRRMLISACEDTGLADPNAIGVVESCAAAFDRIGLPEGQYMLTQAALYLATAPKSNSAMAYFDAHKAVMAEDAEVPNHLRDSSRDAEGFGHGAGYLYPHAYRDHWVAQQYLPDSLDGRVFYNPSDQGYEKTIRADVLSRRELQIAALIEDAQSENDEMVNPIGDWWHAERLKHGTDKTGENLSFTPENKKLAQWQKRTDEGRAESLLELRNSLLDSVQILRHSRCLVLGADDGLFVWETLRRCPEGFTGGLCRTEKGLQILSQYASTLAEIDRPVLSTKFSSFGDVAFDFVFAKDPFSSKDSMIQFLEIWKERIIGAKPLEEAGIAAEQLPSFSENCILCFAQKIPQKSEHLADALLRHLEKTRRIDAELKSVLLAFDAAEEAFFTQKDHPLFSWNETAVLEEAEKLGFSASCFSKTIISKRLVSQEDVLLWFSENSEYGRFLKEGLETQIYEKVHELAESIAIKRISLEWNQTAGFFSLAKKS
ncbi:MAG: AAA family ATPase [Spirochaetaceae bacterium]|nr:AAA family ATPase [Spirochaetaceae bacterium]